MALRTVTGAADQKGKPAFLHFKKPVPGSLSKESLNIDINKVMQNMGGEAFTYETFKNAYDTDPRIKEMVKNFSEVGIQLKTKEDASNGMQGAADGGNAVSKMAQQATDVGSTL
tara:strand:+ start:7315 stop:7656 length:342 start_codon:yes stop_codon:yes gene_type:complete